MGMAYKDPEEMRQYKAAWYKKNKDQHCDNVRRRVKEYQQEIRKYIEGIRSKGCSRCPESDPCCIDFHHRDPAEKEMSIAVIVRRSWSYKRLDAEIAKCDLLCRNCHAKLHRDERL